MRRSRKQEDSAPLFVELPQGLFTASGTWFHVTSESLAQYAGELIERVGLRSLIADAERWLRSPVTISLWLFVIAAPLSTWWEALAGSLLWFAGWTVLSPGFVNRAMLALLRWLEPVWLQGLAYVLVLSWLAGSNQFAAVAAGLAWFILLRWGILTRLAEPLVTPLRRRLYRLAVPDQVLRAVMVRRALALRISLPHLDAMEKRMLDIAFRHKKPRS